MRQTLSDAAGADELLLEGRGNFTMTPSGWSSDARFIAYTTRGSNVWILPLFGDRQPFAFANTAFTETSAVFSPDDRWVAYTSNEGGQADVYVQSFPGPGAKVRVSRNGGSHPVWRADGRESFYLEPDGTLMSVAIGAAASLEAGPPQALFHANVWSLSNNQIYAATTDGQTFPGHGDVTGARRRGAANQTGPRRFQVALLPERARLFAPSPGRGSRRNE